MEAWPDATNSHLGTDELRPIGLFGGLSDEVLGHLAKKLTVRPLHAGDLVFQEGDDAREMYVILAGEMEIVKQSKRGTTARVALLGAGDWFGEMSLLDVQRRSATVRALAPSRLLTLTARDLDSLYRVDLKGYSLLVLNIARELSRRLRVADRLLADFVTSVSEEYVSIRRRPK